MTTDRCGVGSCPAAVVVTAAVAGRAGLADLGRRLVAWRGRRRAWAFALGLPPALLLVCGSIAAWAGGQSPADLDWAAFGQSQEFAALPVGVFWIANWCSSASGRRSAGAGSCNRSWSADTRW